MLLLSDATLIGLPPGERCKFLGHRADLQVVKDDVKLVGVARPCRHPSYRRAGGARELGMDRGFLFDLDGTLVDFHRGGGARELFDAGAAKVYALLTARGCALPPFEQFARRHRSLA